MVDRERPLWNEHLRKRLWGDDLWSFVNHVDGVWDIEGWKFGQGVGFLSARHTRLLFCGTGNNLGELDFNLQTDMIVSLINDLVLGSWLTRDYLEELWHFEAHFFFCTWSIWYKVQAILLGQRILIEAELLRETKDGQLGQNHVKVHNVFNF